MKAARKNYEDDEQKALVDLLTLARIDFYHIPNGGYRPKATGKSLKKAGVKSGVPDLCIITPPPFRHDYRGVYVEMKRVRGGVVSEKQKDWIAILTGHGYCVIVAHGWQDAAKQLRALGYRLGGA